MRSRMSIYERERGKGLSRKIFDELVMNLSLRSEEFFSSPENRSFIFRSI